eukprot:SAG31_NODE_2946_length_4874_cov_1.638534_7_plen_47_part_00
MLIDTPVACMHRTEREEHSGMGDAIASRLADDDEHKLSGDTTCCAN